MKIKILFQGSWENSFLDGTIDDLGIKRNYIGSGKSGFENYKDVKTSHNTVMGILYRLVGEQRKLSQIKLDSTSFFSEIEDKISFEENSLIDDEIIYLRNISGADDKSGFSGPKKAEPTELFSEKYFNRMWGVLDYTVEELQELIISNIEQKKVLDVEKSRIAIGDLLANNIEKNKDLKNIKISLTKLNPGLEESLVNSNLLSQEDIEKGISYKTLVYCGIYTIVNNILKKDPSFAKNLTKSQTIPGISKRTFTQKDFLGAIGSKKKVIGNPSIWEGYKKDSEGKTRKFSYSLKRKRGEIIISIDVDSYKEKEIIEIIENSGVGTFVVGKKGLAYVAGMWSENE